MLGQVAGTDLARRIREAIDDGTLSDPRNLYSPAPRADVEAIRRATEALPEFDPFPSSLAPLPETERLRMLAELERIADERISRTPSPTPPQESVRGSLRAIRSSRRCSSPVGLALKAENGVELRPVPCGKCDECRAHLRRLDVVRVSEAIEAPTLTYVPEERWDAIRQRFNRAESPWLQVPVAGDRRAVISSGFLPGEPVDDLAEVLERLEEKRDRSDKRRGRSSRMRLREEVEAEVYERTEKPVRDVVGYWSPRAVSASSELVEIGEATEAEAAEFGVPVRREGAGVTVEARRHDPRAELLWRRVAMRWLPAAIPWQEGGPPPEEGGPGWESWQAATATRAVVGEDVPLWAYDEAEAWAS